MSETCYDCVNRIGEECGITGREVFPDSEPCCNFSPKTNNEKTDGQKLVEFCDRMMGVGKQ